MEWATFKDTVIHLIYVYSYTWIMLLSKFPVMWSLVVLFNVVDLLQCYEIIVTLSTKLSAKKCCRNGEKIWFDICFRSWRRKTSWQSNCRLRPNCLLKLKRWGLVWWLKNKSWRRFFMTWSPVWRRKRRGTNLCKMRRRKCSHTYKWGSLICCKLKIGLSARRE